jgi:hypothetical protein
LRKNLNYLIRSTQTMSEIPSQFENESATLTELKDMYESNNIEAMHESVKEKFEEYFKDVGYIENAPAPLISKEDKSVIFTGASISAVKHLVQSDTIPNPGVYIVQPCIRTQDFKDAYIDTTIPSRQTFFNMATILAPPKRYPEVCREAIDLTINKLGIDSNRIKIKVTNKDQQLAEYWKNPINQNVATEFDTYPEKYYKWEYGIPGVSGSGLTVSILNQTTESFWDVGNIVILREEGGKETGIEFGYGIEYFLAGALNVEEPLRLSKISEIEPYKGGLHQKYTVCLEALIQMSAAGATIGDKKADHLFKQYIKVVNHLRKSLNLEYDTVLSTCKRYCNKFGLDEAYPALEENLEFMNVHENRIQNFVAYVGNISNTNQKVPNPLKKITDRAQQLGLTPEETAVILKSTPYRV